jgi:hypothetical protein
VLELALEEAPPEADTETGTTSIESETAVG